MKIGSLCSGVGGLDLAVEALTGGTVVWQAETDRDAAKVLEQHWPGVPNHGDLTTFDWTTAEPIDVLCSGFPCQPVSQAGRRKAMADERWLWDSIERAVGDMGAGQPGWIFLENVRGLLSADGGRAFGRVIHGLADLGYVGRYGLLPASAIGAPHRRERVFIAAHAHGAGPQVGRGSARSRVRSRPVQRPTADSDRESAGWLGRTDVGTQEPDAGWPEVDGDRPADDARDAAHACRWGRKGDSEPDLWPEDGVGASLGDDVDGLGVADYGRFQPAIDRWAGIVGRPAPWPPLIGKALNARLTEWLMGLPEGWVTDHTNNRVALRLCGNGVVPQQAEAAYRMLLA